MNVSLKTIAQMTGLSVTTVSHAINGTRAVSKRSKRLVEEAIRQTGYTPNLAAQMLKTNRSKIVALLIPATEPNNSTNSFFFDVLNGAREHLAANDYDLMIATFPELELEKQLDNFQLLKKRLVDGILLVPPTRHLKVLEKICAFNLPLVLLDRRVEGSRLPMVYSDNVEGACRAVHTLAEGGRERIAFLGGNMEFSTTYDRYLGYCRGMQELSLPTQEELIFKNLKYSVKDGEKATELLMREKADAIFVANNVLLLGVLSYFNAHGIQSPEDVSVVSYDDSDWMQVTNPTITATFQNPYRIGEEGAELLMRTLNGEDTTGIKIVLPCEIILRRSHLGNPDRAGEAPV
ncbi:LacI family transcriptional regulator [Caproiciproducens sp. NJN-50]|uniref:LacI family DNA-binding transcriptional regulator n=1 Tax=Acutalibacteraceae TaxID=3082771 RepID=UPI000FFE0E86|nr:MULTISPECIES: LacI family DNA-binding transcriptional regulator [Acutalibacteraceae]QAT50721.1 LacI family transcriptional regulator [Caproiciproducens sp. NJN-50]